jgi:hypothetical protein
MIDPVPSFQSKVDMRALATAMLGLLVGHGAAGQAAPMHQTHGYYRLQRVVRAVHCARSNELLGDSAATESPPGLVRGIHLPAADSTHIVAVNPEKPDKLERFYATVAFPGWIADSVPTLSFTIFLPNDRRFAPPGAQEELLLQNGDEQAVSLGSPAHHPRDARAARVAPEEYLVTVPARLFQDMARAPQILIGWGTYTWDLSEGERTSLRALFRASVCSLDPKDG